MHVLDLFAKSNRPIQEKKQEEKTDADQAADNVKSKYELSNVSEPNEMTSF